MRIAGFTAYCIHVPLRRPFRHASATRSTSDNIVIECRLEDGTVGWGEGVPRTYVTGDTPESSLRLFAGLPVPNLFRDACSNWDEVVVMLDRFSSFKVPDDLRGCLGNPLRAAVESSVLDAFGRAFGQPVSGVAAVIAEAQTLRIAPHSVRYSTTIDSEDPSRLWRSALKMRFYGFAQCKVKIGHPADDDAARLSTIRRWIGPSVDLRVDANEAWDSSEYLRRIERLRPHNISCIEQPVPHGQLEKLNGLRRECAVPIMLDESLTGWNDAQQSIRMAVGDLWNLRLSKCGGFIACLRLAALADRHGIGYQLGCHPGETGILSALGRHWAQSIRVVRYCEGSYDRHVLRSNLIEEEITFGYGGHAPPLTGPGLGITVSREKLRSMTVAQQVHPVLE